MRAMTITQYGEPDSLKIQDMPEPQLQDHDVLVEVHAAAMNPVDTKVRRGMIDRSNPPRIGGYDVSGVVSKVGPKVEHLKEGDEVYASPSIVRPGAHAERVAVDARSAAIKPTLIDHIHAAALPLVTLTAWESLHDRARIHPDETVLIHAGGGGVGHVAIQLAKLHGCGVMTTASREESIALCDKFGADRIINYRDEDFVEVVKAETDGRGLPVVFDTVGEPVFDRCLDCLAINGRLVTIVYNENPRVVQALFRRNATLHMEFMGVPTIHNINPGHQGEILTSIAELVDAGKLAVHVSHTITLEETPDAHRQLEAGHVTGKIVVKIK